MNEKSSSFWFKSANSNLPNLIFLFFWFHNGASKLFLFYGNKPYTPISPFTLSPISYLFDHGQGFLAFQFCGIRKIKIKIK
jgi:hypothetical protein